MTSEDDRKEQPGTVSSEAFLSLGTTLTGKMHKRFMEPGWFYGGASTTACPVDGEVLHVFRKKYRSNGRDYLYAAYVCTGCRSAVAAADLGLKTTDLGLDPRLQQPPTFARPSPSGSPDREPPSTTEDAPTSGWNEDDLDEGLEILGFQALLSECISSLPTESLRHVLMAGLGIGGNALTIRDIAERQHVPKDRIRKLQRHALSMLGAMARTTPGSAPHRLAIELGVSAQPRHLAIAEKVHRFACTDAPPLARHRATLWMQIAGAAPSCSRHVGSMVAQQIKATADWELRQSGGADRRLRANTLQTWLSGAEWPSLQTVRLPLGDVTPKRIPIKNDVSGMVYLATLDREAAYDSGVERQLLLLLDRSPEVKTFVEQPCAIPYDFDGPKTYYPDVLIEFTDGRLLLVEVKDIVHLVDSKNLRKYEAGRNFAHKRGWGWAVCTGGYQTLEGLGRRNVQSHIVQAFKERLRHGPIAGGSLQDLRVKTDYQFLDLLAMTLQQGWSMQHHPFTLSAGRDWDSSSPFISGRLLKPTAKDPRHQGAGDPPPEASDRI